MTHVPNDTRLSPDQARLRSILHSLAEVESAEAPILSIYVDLRPDLQGGDPGTRNELVVVRDRLRHILDAHEAHSPARESLEADVERFERYLDEGADALRPAEGLAVFGCEAAGTWEVVVSPTPFETQVSAGPTAEPLDPVRVLTNRSSGKMGYRIAERASERGAKVVLVSGPSAEPDPAGVAVTRVETAAEMKEAMLKYLGAADVVVMAAAVADYRPEKVAGSKIKTDDQPLTLKLVRNDDILLAIAERRKPDQTIVGFAAETELVEARARGKLEAKRLDLIVANDVSRKDSGFSVESNEATLFRADGKSRKLPLITKRALADEILDEIRDYRARR